MANLSKLKTAKKNRFGDGLPSEETSATLVQPEHAPTDTKKPERKSRGKTGRTIAFGTKVSQEFLDDFRRTAFENNLKYVDLLEQSLEAYKKLNR